MTAREAAVRAFIVDLGQALHRFGASTARIEEGMAQAAARFGLRAQFFVQPTALMAAYESGAAETTYLRRLDPAQTDLSKLCRLDRLLTAVLRQEVDIERAAARLHEILAAPERNSRPLARMLGQLAASGAAARFLGGGWGEVATAAVIGGVIGLLSAWGRRRDAMQRVLLPLAAIVSSFIAMVVAGAGAPLNPQVAMLAGLVTLLPGLTLTIAINELATNHLASGTARAAGATMVFVTLAFGVALGARIAGWVIGSTELIAPGAANSISLVLAVLLAPLALSALFRAPWSEVPWVITGSVIAYGAGAAGQRALGPELGNFIGGLAAGLAANGYARARNRPSAVVYVPALLMLVPGSIGFRAVTALLADQVESGIDTAFATLLSAAALGTGMLVAAVVLPPRRVL